MKLWIYLKNKSVHVWVKFEKNQGIIQMRSRAEWEQSPTASTVLNLRANFTLTGKLSLEGWLNGNSALLFPQLEKCHLGQFRADERDLRGDQASPLWVECTSQSGTRVVRVDHGCQWVSFDGWSVSTTSHPNHPHVV